MEEPCLIAYEHLSNKGVFNKFDELITFKKEFRTEVDFMYHFIPIVYRLNFY